MWNLRWAARAASFVAVLAATGSMQAAELRSTDLFQLRLDRADLKPANGIRGDANVTALRLDDEDDFDTLLVRGGGGHGGGGHGGGGHGGA